MKNIYLVLRFLPSVILLQLVFFVYYDSGSINELRHAALTNSDDGSQGAAILSLFVIFVGTSIALVALFNKKIRKVATWFTVTVSVFSLLLIFAFAPLLVFSDFFWRNFFLAIISSFFFKW